MMQVFPNQVYRLKMNLTKVPTNEMKRTTMTMLKGIMAGVHPLQVQKVLLEEQEEAVVAAFSSPAYGL